MATSTPPLDFEKIVEKLSSNFLATASQFKYPVIIANIGPKKGGIMNRKYTRWTLGLAAVALLVTGTAVANDTPTVAEQMAGLQQMCADTAQARAQRQAEEPLYDRLGGYEKINDLTREVVRLHTENDDIKHMFEFHRKERMEFNATLFRIERE